MHLVDRDPVVDADELITGLVPPPRFDAVRFSTYRPAPDEPSQQAAVTALSAFAETDRQPAAQGAVPQVTPRPAGGYYLDGGFGVGKTHLLASLWHAVPGPKAYGTFVEYTHLVGALGFAETVRRLSGHRLVAVDEFELDDPGDTMLMTRLLGQLCRRRGPPGRDVQHPARQARRGPVRGRGLPSRDPCVGSTFRDAAGGRARLPAPGLAPAPPPMADAELVGGGRRRRAASSGLVRPVSPTKLATLHPSRYGQLVDGVDVRAAERRAAAGPTSRRRCAGWC